MDNHLNIFQAYHSGNQDSPDEVNRLEDNLTRSFIITLKYLQEYDKDQFRSYLAKLMEPEVISVPKRISFDLQNMTDKKALKRIQKSTNKWMLLISRRPYKFEWRDKDKALFDKLEPLLPHDDDKTEDKESAPLLKKLKNSFKMGVPCRLWENSEEEITDKEASSLYGLLHNCRPDGWIYDTSSTNSPLSVLVESKVGNNQFSSSQLYRHLSGKQGFNLGNKAKYFKNVVSVTWGDVLQKLDELTVEPDTLAGEIIKQFKGYMAMSGEVLDIKKLNDDYDEDFAKSQFNLFLDKLDIEIDRRKMSLIRKRRRQFGAWDIYGVPDPKTEKPRENPNFTICFSSGGIEISLTANKNQKFLKNQTIQSFLKKIATNPDCEPRQRYRYRLQTNRIIDCKKGQQQGEKYNSFMLLVNFAEKQWQSIESVDFLIEIADRCIKKGAQEQLIIWQADWVNKDKDSAPLRSANLELFKNPEKLIEQIVNFFQELYPVLQEVHPS